MIRKLCVLLGAGLLVASVAIACAPAQAPTPTPTKAPAAAPTQAPAAAPTKAAAPTQPPAATPTQPPAPTPTVRPVTLKYGSGGGGNIHEVGVWVALEKGYFKEQGISIEVVPFALPTEIMGPLSTGQVDAANINLMPPLLAALDRGIELKMGAGAGQWRSGWEEAAIVLRKDLSDSGKVKTAADLKGMKVAIPGLGTAAELGFLRLFEQAGLKSGDVEIMALGSPDMLAAFQNKAIAASWANDLIAPTGVQQGLFVKWMPLSSFFGGKLQGTVQVYGPGALAKDQDVARRYYTAYLKGVRDYLKAFTTKEGRQEVVNALVKNTVLKDPKVYEGVQVPYIDPNGEMDLKSMDDQGKFFVEKGMYTGKRTFQEMVDLSAVQFAAQKLGKQ